MLAVGGCGPTPHRSRAVVRIAAAADLRYALDELTRRFAAQRPDVDVTVSYGSSGSFYAQIENGAPFDVFLSADAAYPRRLETVGLADPDAEFTYAVGRIVLWAAGSSPVDVGRGFEALGDPRVTRIAIANPEHAPYGRAAIAALHSAGVYERTAQKLVYGENVSQALQFVQTGAADVGIVARSLVVVPATSTGRFWDIPQKYYPTIEQRGTILKTAASAEAARAVRAFLLSRDAIEVLKRYGFSVGQE